VDDLAESDGSSCIVQAVVNIAAAHHITTTAESVETREQRKTLRALGCSENAGLPVQPGEAYRGNQTNVLRTGRQR
jgi:EAL domain-containing protein (putative c-di-GMP-specific phosphodiesterase class I)